MKSEVANTGVSSTEMGTMIQKKAYELGFEKCGIVTLDQLAGYGEMMEDRVKKVPESAGFYRMQKRLASPLEGAPWAKSVIVATTRYGVYHVPEEVRGHIGKSYLFDTRVDENSREFQNKRRMEAFLDEQDIRWETNRKFGNVGLRWAAQKAGLGLVRRNNFLYTESGSWVHLEGWLVDLEVEQLETNQVAGCPEGCRRCIESCPTGSLSQPYTMSPTACISFLTTFGGRDAKKLGEISKSFGACVYGCDICQNVCPMNRGKWEEREEFPGLKELAQALLPGNIVTMTEEFYRSRVQPKFFYLQPDELWKWKVNALCYLRNDDNDENRRLIKQACSDENEKVREMAVLIWEELQTKNSIDQGGSRE